MGNIIFHPVHALKDLFEEPQRNVQRCMQELKRQALG